MRRWATARTVKSIDHEELHQITIYPEESTKIDVKSENRKYNYTRLLLVPEKAHNYPRYRVAKMSRI